MPLLFQPKPKSIVICDFNGFVVPEMVKVRPVVILSSHKHNSLLVTIVPLSTTEPIGGLHHHELSACPFPDKPKGTRMWAKCDMVYTVRLDRLDRYKMKVPGGRKYIVPAVSDQDYLSVQAAVRVALGL